MFGWNNRPTRAEVKHRLGGDNPARVVSVGYGHYEVTIPNDPEADVTYTKPYYSYGDPRSMFPGMEIRDGELCLPLEDVTSLILSRVKPEEIAVALWQHEEVKAEFMDALRRRWSERGLDDEDRRKFLADVKEAVHDEALDKLASAMSSMEYAIAKNYYLHSEIRAINETLEHYGVTRPPRGEETEPQPLRIKDESQVGQFKIAGTAWNEARDYWRAEIRRQFPLPASADTHPKDEDATEIAAEFMSGAVPNEDSGDAQ